MVTFVPFFVSQECTDWFTRPAGRSPPGRGLDPDNLADVFGLLPEWEKDHPAPAATLAQVADHIDHVRAGGGHRATSASAATSTAPRSCRRACTTSAATRPCSPSCAAAAGPSADLAALAGGNILRVLRDADAYAAAAGQ